MKTLTKLIVILFLFQSCYQTALITDRQKMLIKGDVNEIIEYSYKSYPWRDTLFCDRQDIIHCDHIEYWIFNKDGIIIETGYMFSPDEKSVFTTSHFPESYSESYNYYSVHEFDQFTNGDEKLDSTRYKVKKITQNDTLYQITYFEHPLSFDQPYCEDSVRLFKKAVLDKYGRKTYEEIGIDDVAESHNYEYMNNGLIKRKKQKSFWSSGYNESKYKYNRFGQIKSEEHLSKDFNYIIKFEYFYDSQDNWINQVGFDQGKPDSYKIRAIKYF